MLTSPFQAANINYTSLQLAKCLDNVCYSNENVYELSPISGLRINHYKLERTYCDAHKVHATLSPQGPTKLNLPWGVHCMSVPGTQPIERDGQISRGESRQALKNRIYDDHDRSVKSYTKKTNEKHLKKGCKIYINMY